MKITDKQAAALHFIASNPGSSVTEIAEAADASTFGSNAAEFVRRMIDSGMVQVVVTSEVDAMIEDGVI